MKKNFSLNLTKEEHGENDYFVCWEEIGSRPNKINLFDVFDVESFSEFIESNAKKSYGVFMDILPNGDDYVVNEKNLIKLSDGVFVSFVYLNKLSNESVVSDVTLIYGNDFTEEVNQYLDEVSRMSVRLDLENTNYRIKIATLNQSGFEVEPLDPMELDVENIESYYNDETFKSASKLVKSIKKNHKGLTLIHGERGCGKTSLVNWIISSLDKSIIYIPSSLIETTITPEFRNFLKRYKNSVLVFDDMEVYFHELSTKMNLIANNILQLVDGFQSDDLSLNIICIFNLKSESDLDDNLVECNNLIDIIEVDSLSDEKAEELSKLLKTKNKYKQSTKLINIIKDKKSANHTTKIGY